ncbi:glutamate-ammonia-ligase adenylyltransferase [Sanguibacter gelidistatuariae]|uniref:Bifunctional glutamine synthetase adenylyltransferase/adenylyl-removing enzyme n=1 Tax=Sanguibacter gelidistatuariae TaxID=1814289 RepID=A0A1G6SB35_9MICO|nr:bifunctional [glutamine synthetase] adenylyltransferase/[glutamine synthetase]-adenylyl-L-tyrosine phosphorylase [Sanguibacter gelidistatuariae]SDD13337.1 glutamate-ammonia-ligase adenylyltransferase [Sanguibacter gelidistatuariae]
MVSTGRTTSLTGRLTRLGFSDARRAAQLCADSDLVAVVGEVTADSGLVVALGDAADPDLALLSLVRLCSALLAEDSADSVRRAELVATSLTSTIWDGDDAGVLTRRRLVAVLGASIALGDELVRHPELVDVVADATSAVGVDVRAVRAEMLAAVGADADAVVPVASSAGPEVTDSLRRAYRSRLLRIAATDLTSTEPLSILPAVAAALADLAAGALEAALAVARAEIDDHGVGVRLAVMGMGKCGGRELNYVSDVDVIYVAEPVDGFTEDYASTVGARLAAGLTRVCGAPSGEPALWPVDAALRPEGKNGPLVRTLASHVSYYERWAKTWEFQALLKARLVAGDAELGYAYVEAITPMVWSAVSRANFVEDSQAMRRRVEDHVPAAEADRQLKLGKGGLRDVEFTVQLLQLVHGRSDPSIQSSNTLTALAALASAGYVGREHAAQLAVCYRFLRVLEHRIQLFHLRRTHLMPTADDDLRRLARSAGLRLDGPEGLLARWRTVRRDVRTLHEELFYRPLLPATAQLSAEEASLAPEAAKARLAAIGYRDPAGSMRHIAALTDGVSRRASIQRQLLPVMLGWFAEGSDPDSGLLAFRRLSDELGTTHWYLKLLRDSGSAAYRLASLLSTSKYVAEALGRSPESVKWLADDADLRPRSLDRLLTESDAFLSRADDPQRAITVLRAMRRRELARIACAELLEVSDPSESAPSISDAADALLIGGLRIARRVVCDEQGIPHDQAPATMAVIAMGRLGGREVGYGSDADVMFVYTRANDADDAAAQAFAKAVAQRMRTLLGGANEEPPLQVDADLRPEGRNGPLVRSFDSYAEYYGRWSAAWESQALLRARPAAGDPGLGDAFMDLIAPLRYPEGGIDAATVREIRRIKARVESERLPRGVDPARHLKLGRGAISDVEWTVQLLQLQHGYAVPGLRTTETLAGLRAACEAELISADDAEVLGAAWQLASNLRDALVLWSGRIGGATADVLPSDHRALRGIATALRYPGGGADLEEDFLRTARRARLVMERLFYGEEDA